MVHPLNRIERAKNEAQFEETIGKFLDERQNSICKQIILTILEHIVLHVLAGEYAEPKKRGSKEKKMARREQIIEIYRCFKQITRILFPLEKTLQRDYVKELTEIVGSVLSSSKEEGMQLLDEYIGRYIRSTWRVFDEKNKPMDVDILQTLYLKPVPPFLSTKTLKYYEGGLIRDPFSKPREVRVLILKVSPSDVQDPSTLNYLAKSLILFKCPECAKVKRTNFIISNYDFGFSVYSTLIDPFPMCQDGHAYGIERNLITMHPYT